MSEQANVPEAEAQPPLGCLLRLFWMVFGNVALLFAGLEVASSDELGVADAVYAGATAALLLARYVDIVQLRGLTTHATPATTSHLRRYVVVVLGVSLLGWVTARAVSLSW